MSFLSSLLCCSLSETDDDNHLRSRNSHQKRITPTQSQIQKSLSASMGEGLNKNTSVKVNSPNKKSLSSPQNTSHNQQQHQDKSHSPTIKLRSQQQTKPTAIETTAAKDSSDSSKDTQSIVANDEITVSETTLQSAINNDTAHNIEHEEEYDSPETDQNSISSSSSSSEDYERSESLDLTAFQPGQSMASSGWLLEKPTKEMANKKCLVLDLDETLVHSSFKYVRQADFVIPVEIEGQVHNVYVIKRPGVDEFLQQVSRWYEVVVFTASVSRYGDPLLDILDKERTIHHRLFRDSCYNYQGNYIKNLSQMGRDLKNLIIIDNSPASYIFHPQHAVPISSWFSDTHDCELLDILPLLNDLSGIDDIRLSLDINI